MADHLSSLSQKLVEWATEKPLVNRLWIFGSRARNDYRVDSDLDVAIELDMSAPHGFDDSGGFVTWVSDTKSWKEEIELISGLRVDLQRFAGPDTPTIQLGINNSSLLIYKKSVRAAKSPAMLAFGCMQDHLWERL